MLYGSVIIDRKGDIVPWENILDDEKADREIKKWKDVVSMIKNYTEQPYGK